METQQLVGGWTALVQSAVDFLAENGLVVTSGLEASQVATYSWIGQTKDSDMLPDLCSTWFLQQQHPSSSHQTYNMTPHLDSSFEGKLDVEATSDLNDSMLNSPLGVGLGEFGEDASDIGSSTVLDSSDVVHPPRSVTSWTVRPSTLEEKLNYRVKFDNQNSIHCLLIIYCYTSRNKKGFDIWNRTKRSPSVNTVTRVLWDL